MIVTMCLYFTDGICENSKVQGTRYQLFTIHLHMMHQKYTEWCKITITGNTLEPKQSELQQRYTYWYNFEYTVTEYILQASTWSVHHIWSSLYLQEHGKYTNYDRALTLLRNIFTASYKIKVLSTVLSRDKGVVI